MNGLSSLKTWMDDGLGDPMLLPEELAQFYGLLRFPPHPGQLWMITNFVSSLDGVVSLAEPGHEGGGDISGFSPHDRALMGLLRAVADVVLITSSSLRVQSRGLWTADEIYPPFAGAYSELRRAFGKHDRPLHVVVTATGDANPSHRVFTQAEVPVLVLTTQDGAGRLRKFGLPSGVEVISTRDYGRLSGNMITGAIRGKFPDGLVLVEGGPHLVGALIRDRIIDELFLTMAPQVAGRDENNPRPGFVAGQALAPDHPAWSKLVSLKSAADLLFLRYRFEHTSI